MVRLLSGKDLDNGPYQNTASEDDGAIESQQSISVYSLEHCSLSIVVGENNCMRVNINIRRVDSHSLQQCRSPYDIASFSGLLIGDCRSKLPILRRLDDEPMMLSRCTSQ